MRRPQAMRYFALSVLSSALLLSTGSSTVRSAFAQATPACEPPRANEYLLLVLNQQQGTAEQLRQLLPSNAVITPCAYLNEQVVRVGGFASADIANAWAQYLADMSGLQAFVARPAEATTATVPPANGSASGGSSSGSGGSFPTPTQLPTGGTSTPTTPSIGQGTPNSGSSTNFPAPTQPTGTSPAPAAGTPSTTTGTANSIYSPQPLGAGYAVVVQYFNRPEVAADVQQLTSQPVGLVAYEQRPFLLAAYTTDANAATAVLRLLSEKGFTAAIVDSRRAILLTPAVVGTEGRQG